VTQFFYDLEFLERGPNYPIAFISIGIVHPESGQKYYAVSSDAPATEIQRNPWMKANVWAYLPTTPLLNGRPCRCLYDHLDKSHPDVKSPKEIATEVSMFVRTLGSLNRDDNKLWAWYSAYDHVVLCQLFGSMIDLPGHMPMVTWDLKTEHLRQGAPALPEQDAKQHHALADAEWNVEIAKFLGVLPG
jgi:hypothetical protein